MTTIITAEEMLQPETLIGKTAHEQLLMLPVVGRKQDMVYVSSQFHTPVKEIDWVIEHQETLKWRDTDTGKMVICERLSDASDMELYLDEEIEDILDISLIKKDNLTVFGLTTLRSIDDLHNRWVKPLDDGQTIVFRMKDIFNRKLFSHRGDAYAAFTALIDEQVHEFDVIWDMILKYLPDGYQQPSDSYLVVRTKKLCYLIHPQADKLIFIGEYSDEFIAMAEPLVISKDTQEVSSVSPVKAELTTALQVAKANGITLEDLVRLAVEIYN